MTQGKETQSPSGIDALEERLWARVSAVELEARRLRSRLHVSTLALLLLAGLMGVQLLRPELLPGRAPSELRAASLVLVDGSGQSRGQWAVDAQGNARLTMLDEQGRPRLRLAVLDGGSPGITLIDADGANRAAFGLLPDQTSTLVFADAAGVARAVLGLTADHAANLVFADARGVSRVGLGVDANGTGSALLPAEEEAAAATDSTLQAGGG